MRYYQELPHSNPIRHGQPGSEPSPKAFEAPPPRASPQAVHATPKVPQRSGVCPANEDVALAKDSGRRRIDSTRENQATSDCLRIANYPINHSLAEFSKHMAAIDPSIIASWSFLTPTLLYIRAPSPAKGSLTPTKLTPQLGC